MFQSRWLMNNITMTSFDPIFPIFSDNFSFLFLAYDFEVFLRGDVGEKNGIYTWREAKNYCMSLKDGWQLVIIDSEDKQQKVREAFEAAGAEDGDAAWIGFENDDGKTFLVTKR